MLYMILIKIKSFGNSGIADNFELSFDFISYYSFDQHALIDLPAMINHALSVSKQDKIYYVGHSQGTMMGFAGFTSNVTLANQISGFYALAPVSTVKHIKGLLKYLSDNWKILAVCISLYNVTLCYI